MSKAAFGKSMENVRKRQGIKLFSNSEEAQKAVNKPTFKISPKTEALFSEQ